ncbi:hypothetical protein PM082_012261 [Marasmius tenuissimus]|nr:hypothetical protein PM082_012261 [Marasmius tenuissimus]
MVSSRAVIVSLGFLAGVAHAAPDNIARQVSNPDDFTLSELLDKEAPECKTLFQGADSDIDACETAACVCTQEKLDNYGKGINCILARKPEKLAVGQEIIGTIVSFCRQNNIDVVAPKVTPESPASSSASGASAMSSSRDAQSSTSSPAMNTQPSTGTSSANASPPTASSPSGSGNRAFSRKFSAPGLGFALVATAMLIGSL